MEKSGSGWVLSVKIAMLVALLLPRMFVIIVNGEFSFIKSMLLCLHAVMETFFF
jgi:hypothetical protein